MACVHAIGFWVFLAVLCAAVWLFVRVNPMKLEGMSSWIEMYSDDALATEKFLHAQFGIKIASRGKSVSGDNYFIIQAAKSFWPFAGIMQIDRKKAGQEKLYPHTATYFTTADYDATHKKMLAAGAKPILACYVAGGMKFGVYIIPGGVEIGLVQYGRHFR